MDFLEDDKSGAVDILSRRPNPVFPDEAPWSQIIDGLQKRLELTSEAMASLLGIDKRTVSAWRTGQQAPQLGCQQLLLWLLAVYAEVEPSEWPKIFPIIHEEARQETVITPKRILSLRKSLMMRQRDLAYLLRISRSQVSTWEHGKEKPGWCANLLLRMIEAFPGPASNLLERVPGEGGELTKERALDIRQHLNMTQAELSDLLGLTVHGVQEMEYDGVRSDCGSIVYMALESYPNEVLEMLADLHGRIG